MNATMARLAFAARYGADLQTKLYSVRQRSNGNVEVCYRGSLVVLVAAGSVLLDSHGWMTVTTKRVMNAVLWGISANALVRQRKWEWFVERPNEPPLPFTDGMEIVR